MKKTLVLLLVFTMVFALTACGGGNGGGGDAEALDLSVCIASEPSTIDPALNSAVDGAIMLHHTFEGLIKWVDDGNGNATLAEGMADSYEVSEDGLVYTFHIREGALWSDVISPIPHTILNMHGKGWWTLPLQPTTAIWLTAC